MSAVGDGGEPAQPCGLRPPPTPRLPTGIYMVAMKHRARLSQADRAAFAQAIAWASMGTSAQSTGLELVPAPEPKVPRPHS